MSAFSPAPTNLSPLTARVGTLETKTSTLETGTPKLYAPTGRWISPSLGGNGASVFANGNARVLSIELPPRTVTQLACEVTTAGSAATSFVRIVAWADNNGLPGAIVADSARILADTIGFKTAVVSINHPGGLLWVAAINQGAPAVDATLRFISSSGRQTIGDALNVGLNHAYVIDASVLDAPTANPVGTFNPGAGCPFVLAKV